MRSSDYSFTQRHRRAARRTLQQADGSPHGHAAPVGGTAKPSTDMQALQTALAQIQDEHKAANRALRAEIQGLKQGAIVIATSRNTGAVCSKGSATG